MVYGYIRVSTGKQDMENQRFEIQQFCGREGLKVDYWVEETISGTRNYDKRKLGKLLELVHDGDLILCSELSRLGRSLYMIMDILSECLNRGCRVWTIKDNFRLGDDVQSKVLAFAFGLSAEIERNLISQRTKEALEKKKAEGVRLGRPKGALSKTVKLSGKDQTIRDLLSCGNSYAAVARLLNVDRSTLVRYCKSRELGSPEKKGKDALLTKPEGQDEIKTITI